jgi:hypothetical protein
MGHLGAINKVLSKVDLVPIVRSILENTKFDQDIATHPPKKILRLQEKYATEDTEYNGQDDESNDGDDQEKPRWKVNCIQGMRVKNLSCKEYFCL